MTITSPHNPQLKELQRLIGRRRSRERAGRFVAEGEDLLAAADRAGWTPIARYVAAGSGLAGTEVEPGLLAAASELGSGTRVLAVYEERWAPAPTGPLCVALYGVGDPGNVGTILRGAHAFGAACVALGPGCADPFGPKAVRASMGAVFELPICRDADPDRLPRPLIALASGAGRPLHDTELHRGGSLLIGAEREGLPAAVVAAADAMARIEIAGDSLNAAMAATVALYECSRRMAAES